MKKILACGMILGACIIFAFGYDKFTTLPVELYQSRFLIWKLARNDFKKRYAGSYMGAVWAMVQPVVTVGMYYIVFDKKRKNGYAAFLADLHVILPREPTPALLS